MFYEKEFPIQKLSEVCSKITDGTHKTPKYQEKGITFISAKNIIDGKLDFSDVKYITQQEYEEIQKRCQTEHGDVLMAKSGSLGTLAIVDTEEPLGLFESLAVLKYDRHILNGIFLKEQLRSDMSQQRLMTGVKGVAVKHLHLNVISEVPVIVPPMELQKEFAEFVQQSDKSKFSGFKSQFIEMFGDPEENPKGWRKTTFEEISEIITDGEHATPRRVDEGIYLLSARNVLNHELSFDQVDYIDQDEYDRIAKRIVPKAGDVLISCSGTVGRACVVPDNLVFQMVRSVALVRFKSDINPVFMEQQITMPFIQNQIDASKSQTSQANLFQGKIKKLEAMVPPVDLQKEFLEFVEQSDKSKLIAA